MQKKVTTLLCDNILYNRVFCLGELNAVFNLSC